MRKYAVPIIITLAILLPGLIAGTVVAYFYIHQPKHTAPPSYTVRLHYLHYRPSTVAAAFLPASSPPRLSPRGPAGQSRTEHL